MYKIVKLISLLYLKFYQNFKNYHGIKLSKTYLVKYILHHHQGQFSGTTSLDDIHLKKILWHSFEKRFYAIFFCFYTMFCRLDPLAWIANLFYREYGFSINSKISFMSSGDKSILTLKILVTNFCRFWYFDIKIVLLGQNSFKWIAFCLSWVLCILNLYWSFKIFRQCHFSWLFQFYLMEFFVKS